MGFIFLLIFVISFIISFSDAIQLNDVKDLSSTGSSLNCIEAFEVPTNHNCSIQYQLYTKDNKNSPSYLEPNNQDFDPSEFDSCRKTFMLIHGYSVKLKPGNLYEQIKDSLLKEDSYNVIIVDWTKYNQAPDYPEAFKNAFLVGQEVGKFINFLTNQTEVDPSYVHVVGHSLGAHVAGVAGKQVPGLGRITGLDPAFPLYAREITINRLTESDANFVDVIHCSNGWILNGIKGYGYPFPMGSIDFYVNGGTYQPSCKIGRDYSNTDGEVKKIQSNDDLVSCRHDICPIYFLYSISKCNYLAKECGSYKKYKTGRCRSKSHPSDLMGLYAKSIPGLPNHTKFYVTTTQDPPYCSD